MGVFSVYYYYLFYDRQNQPVLTTGTNIHTQLKSNQARDIYVHFNDKQLIM